MADLAQLGIVVNVSDQNAAQKLTALSTAADKATTSVDRLEKSTRRASDGLNTTETASQRATRNYQKVSAELSTLQAAFDRVITRIKQFSAFLVAAAAITTFMNAVRGAINIIIDFDQALKSLQAIAGATAIEAQVMGDVIKQIAADTKFSAQEVAEGMQTIGKAGFTAGETLKMIQGVSNLATGALEDFNTVASLVVTAIRAFGLEVVQTAEITDIFANAITKSKLSTDMLVTAFGYVGAAGAQAGLTLNEVSGTLMVLSDNGIRASTMGTALRKTLLSMLAPNESLKNALYSVGMTLDDINPGMVGYEQALRNITPLVWDFEKATVDMAKAKEFFGIRASQVAAILIRETAQGGGISKAIESTKDLGAALRMAEKQQEGLGVKFKNLSDSIKNVALAIGEAGLTNTLHNVVDALKAVTTAIENFIKNVPAVQFVGYATAIAGISAAVYGLIKALNMLMASAAIKAIMGGFLSTPFGWITTAVIGAAGAIAYFTNKLDDKQEALKRTSVEINQNIDTLESWRTVLKKAADEGLSEFNSMIVRFVAENKTLSSQILENINSRKAAGDELYTSFEQLLVSARTTEEAFSMVDDALANIQATKIKEDIEVLTQVAAGYSEEMGNLEEKLKRFGTGNYPGLFKNLKEKTEQELQELKDLLLNESNELAEIVFNLAKTLNKDKEWGIEFIKGVEDAFGNAGVEAALDRFVSIWKLKMENAGKSGVDALKTWIGKIPDYIKEMEKDIPVLKIADYEKQKADLEKHFNEMRNTIIKSDLFKEMGISVSELEEQLRTALFAALVKVREGLDEVKKSSDKVVKSVGMIGAAFEELNEARQTWWQTEIERNNELMKTEQDRIDEINQMVKESGDFRLSQYDLEMRKAEETYIKLLADAENLGIEKEKIDLWYKNRKEEIAQKASEKVNNIQKKEVSEYQKLYEKALENIQDEIADTFYDIFDGQLDSFEDFADSMLDIFKRMLANMAAEAAMTNIFKPMMNQMAGSALGNILGLPSASSPTSLLSAGKSAWNIFSGNTSHLAYKGLTAMGVPGAVGGTAAQTAVIAGGGSMAEAASLSGGSIGGSGIAGKIASVIPYAAIAAIAMPVIMDFVSKKYDAPIYESNITGMLSRFGTDLKTFNKVTQEWSQFGGLRSGSTSSWQYSPFGTSYSYDDSGKIESVDVNAAIALNKVLMSVTESVSSYAEEIGQNSEKIKDITKEISINTAGMNPEQIMGELEKEFFALGELMAEEVLKGSWKALTDNYQTENALVVLERLATNTIAVKDAFEKLSDGMAITAPKIAGLSMSLSKTKITSDLAEMFGGADIFSSSIDAFFKSFYSRDEQIEYFLQVLSDSLPIAIEKIPTTLDAFKEETKRWLETYAATGDKLAGEQFRAFVAFGPEFARLIGNEVNNKRSDLFISALELLGQDKMVQAVTRSRALDELDESLRPLQEFVWALEDGAKRIDDATSGLDTIRGTIAGILGGSQTPQSKTFFEGRYSALLAEAQADPSKVSAFTEFTSQYLDFIKDYGDPKATERVLKDLWGLEDLIEDQASMADQITGTEGKTLSDLYLLIEKSGARNILPENIGQTSNYEYIGLQLLDHFMKQFPDIHPGFFASADPSKRPTPGINEELLSFAQDIWAAPPLGGNLYTFANSLLEKYGISPFTDMEGLRDIIGFSGGGSISGPTSGYTVPVTFHGKEHISTDSDMKDVKSLLQALVSQSGNGTVKVYVKVGDSGEFREVVADVMRSDPETQEITRRVVNG